MEELYEYEYIKTGSNVAKGFLCYLFRAFEKQTIISYSLSKPRTFNNHIEKKVFIPMKLYQSHLVQYCLLIIITFYYTIEQALQYVTIIYIRQSNIFSRFCLYIQFTSKSLLRNIAKQNYEGQVKKIQIRNSEMDYSVFSGFRTERSLILVYNGTRSG